MNNFEADLMTDSDVETEQPITAHLNLSTKRGRSTGSKTTKKPETSMDDQESRSEANPP